MSLVYLRSVILLIYSYRASILLDISGRVSFKTEYPNVFHSYMLLSIIFLFVGKDSKCTGFPPKKFSKMELLFEP